MRYSGAPERLSAAAMDPSRASKADFQAEELHVRAPVSCWRCESRRGVRTVAKQYGIRMSTWRTLPATQGPRPWARLLISEDRRTPRVHRISPSKPRSFRAVLGFFPALSHPDVDVAALKCECADFAPSSVFWVLSLEVVSHEHRSARLGPLGRLRGLAAGVFDLLHEDDDTAAMCCDRQQRGVPDLRVRRGSVSGLPAAFLATAAERLSAPADVQ